MQVHCDGRLFHCDSIRLDDAKGRARLIREVVARARERFGVEADTETLEAELLAIIEKVANQPAGDTTPAPVEYQVVEYQEDPDRNGQYAVTDNGTVQLTNRVIVIERDTLVEDEGETLRHFEGRVTLHGVATDFKVSSDEYGIGFKLLAAIYQAAGPKVRVYCKTEVLARAISSVSAPERRATTSAFGWSAEGDEYRTPSVRIDAEGIHPTGADDPVRVDLAEKPCAGNLDFVAPRTGELDRLKRHVVKNLLPLHYRRVTYVTPAAAALAVLIRFVSGMNRPAVWLVGLTGGGKSFVAELFQNFFGNFPVELGSAVGSWSSTAYFLPQQGYLFKDALYLVDDFKPEVVRHADVVKLLQNYADGSARGRLNRDATSNVSRPIRGILLATGESLPELTPSALARTVIVAVESRSKQVQRGGRCLALRHRYPSLKAGFIHYLLRHDRPGHFEARVGELQQLYYGPIIGAQNDLRIAGYLGGAWPDGEEKTRAFVERDLAAVRDEMVGAVKGQQASEIFLATLGALVEHGRVRVEGWASRGVSDPGLKYQATIGKVVPRQGGRPLALDICTSLALEVVQESLRKQGRPPLPATARSLPDQLAADGKLLDRDGRAIDPEARGGKTHDAKLQGSTRKAFRIAADELVEPRSRSTRTDETSPGGTDD